MLQSILLDNNVIELISGNVPLAVFVLITTVFGYKVHLRTRLLASSLIMIICFIIIQIMASLDTDSNQQALLVIILVVNTIYSSVNAIFQVVISRFLGHFRLRVTLGKHI